MKLLLTIIVILEFCACSEVSREELPDLEGEWMYTKETANISGDDVGLKFEDDTVYVIRNSGLWQEGKYTLKQGEVDVVGFGGIKTKYFILNHLPDTVKISRGNHVEKLYSRRLEYNPNLKFDKIIFNAGGCYGECPEFIMTLYGDGDVNFQGTTNTKSLGNTKFKVETRALQTIDSLFKWSYIDSLDATKDYGAVDGWGMEITFYYTENRVKTINGTSMEMPFRLKKIIRWLTDEARKKDLI